MCRCNPIENFKMTQQTRRRKTIFSSDSKSELELVRVPTGTIRRLRSLHTILKKMLYIYIQSCYYIRLVYVNYLPSYTWKSFQFRTGVSWFWTFLMPPCDYVTPPLSPILIFSRKRIYLFIYLFIIRSVCFS